MKVTIETGPISKYGNVLQVTLIGGANGNVNITNGVFDLTKGTLLTVDGNGSIIQKKEENENA